MAEYLPRPLRPNTATNRYLNQFRREIRRAIPSRGSGVRLLQRSNGTIIEADPSKGGGTPAEGIVFRGDWDPNGSYSPQDAIAIRGGISAGFYICHTSAPSGSTPPSPADNSKWTLVVSGNAMGLWL